MAETRLDISMLTLFQPCPLDGCNHSRAMHNETDQTVTGFRCRARDPRCPCGEQVVDLANEEWS